MIDCHNGSCPQWSNDPFFKESEETCNNAFESFSNEMKWFKKIERQNIESIVDYKCIDAQDRDVWVELKFRTNHINQYSTTFIEEHKYRAMIKEWRENGTIPLYINFYRQPDRVGIFDLRRFLMCEKKEVELYDKGHKCWKKETRLLLDNERCMYYEKDENNMFIRKW